MFPPEFHEATWSGKFGIPWLDGGRGLSRKGRDLGRRYRKIEILDQPLVEDEEVRIEQKVWTEERGWQVFRTSEPGGSKPSSCLVLLFGSTATLRRPEILQSVARDYPESLVMGCSSAGEICGIRVFDDSLVLTAIEFETSRIEGARRPIHAESSREVGVRLVESLETAGLVHVFVLSEGIDVNGSELVEGLTSRLPEGVTVTGGLSGDLSDTRETLVHWNGDSAPRTAAVLGLYGDRLRVGYGSLGGWDPFGPERLITRSEGNVLYELDGRSALQLYKDYLGDHAADLPASALLFPLSLRSEDGGTWVVRTILDVDEEQQTMTFAGDLPTGAHARLMKANFNRLLDGAGGAAERSVQGVGERGPELGILISCVGRKMVLKQRVEEEVEAVREVLGPAAALTGFYSHGEISPFTPEARCELHNQTMTITTLSED